MTRASGDAGQSLGRRLSAAFALVVLLMLLVGAVGAVTVEAVNTRQDRIRTQLTPAVESTAAVLQAMVDAETGVRGYLLGSDDVLLEPYRGRRAEAGVELRNVERLIGDEHPATGRVDRLRTAVDGWFTYYAEPAVADPEAARTPGRDRVGKRLLDDVRAAAGDLRRELSAERRVLRQETDDLRQVGFWGVVGLTVLAAGIGTLTGIRTVRWVQGPTDRLRQVVERLRMGEYTARADADAGPAEVRRVAQAVNTLAGEATRLRTHGDEAARLRTAVAEAGRRMRQEIASGSVTAEEAVGALGGTLGADLAWYRPVSEAGAWGTVTGAWSADGGPCPDLSETEVVDVADARGLLRTGEALVVPNVLRSQRPAGAGTHELAGSTGATALMCVPVGSGDELLGMLTVVVTSGVRDFTAGERAAAQSVAFELGLALTQVRLFEQQADLVERLQELNRQKSDFLSTVSHELRTPLTSIAGYAELIRDGDAGPVSPQVSSMLEVVERNTVRLRALIEDLLTLSSIEAGAFRSEQRSLRVADLVRAAHEAVRPQAVRAEVAIQVDEGPAGLRVDGDEMQLERVLLNLLTNAVKFTPAAGSVALTVAVDEHTDGVTITCTDTGIGIPEADQEHLFNRFFRARNAVAQAVPGTGLGLVIVRGVVDRHGGTLELCSREGEGTTVVVRLPAAQRAGAML